MLTFNLILPPSLASIATGSDVRTGPVSNGLRTVRVDRTEPTTLTDVLGALGIPACEIGPICRNESEASVDPTAVVRTGGTFRVASAPVRKVQDPRFLTDLHLGTLKRLLRVCGFDAACERSGREDEMARRGIEENRIVLSRNRALLKRRCMKRAQLIRSDYPDRQLSEVLRRFDLTRAVKPFGRCVHCGGVLRTVPKDQVAERIPPRTARWLDDYYVCADCDHLFWDGTHVTALRARIDAALAACRNEDP